MKNLIVLLSLLLSVQSFAGQLPKAIEGEVIDTVIGEMDPYVGDYCVVFVKSYKTGQIFGLVSEEGPSGDICLDAEVSEKGWPVGAYEQDLDFIYDRNLRTSLQDFAEMVFGKKIFFLSHPEKLTNLDNTY